MAYNVNTDKLLQEAYQKVNEIASNIDPSPEPQEQYYVVFSASNVFLSQYEEHITFDSLEEPFPSVHEALTAAARQINIIGKQLHKLTEDILMYKKDTHDGKPGYSIVIDKTGYKLVGAHVYTPEQFRNLIDTLKK